MRCEIIILRTFVCALGLLATSLPVNSLAQTKVPSSQKQGQSGPAAREENDSTGADWPSYGGRYSHWRFSALNQINADNVGRLLPAWIFQTGDYGAGLQATPIVVNGVLYVSTATSQVYALDGATGRILWHFKYPPPTRGLGVGGFPQTRGVAVANGKVFVGTYDDVLVALDAKSGEELWRIHDDDPQQCGCGITGAPLVVRDKVIVGQGGETPRRGHITAYDTNTGHLVWRFYTIPAPGEQGNETWAGDSWKRGAGSPWMTGSYDPELNLLYWGVGNPDPWFGTVREGTNLYTECIVALDADTGRLRWYYQEIPHDVWDFDATYELVLIDREISGRLRKLLVQYSKSGLAFVLDRATGEFVKGYPFVENLSFIKGIDNTGKLFGRREMTFDNETSLCPSNVGGKQWNHVAYSPQTKLVYVPVIEMCTAVRAIRVDPIEGRSYTGTSFVLTPPPGREYPYSHLDAVNPLTGEKAWTYPYKYILQASILATAGNLVFTGDPEGNFFALNAKTGQRLWAFQTGAGHRGSSVTYMVNGRQYIATPTGWNSLASRVINDVWPEAENFQQGSTLVVFALPEGLK